MRTRRVNRHRCQERLAANRSGLGLVFMADAPGGHVMSIRHRTLCSLAALALLIARAGRGVPWQDAPAPPATLRPPHDPASGPLPKGAVARFGSVRFRLGDSAQALAVSRDGKLVAAVAPGRPAGLKVWSIADGRELHHLTHRGYRAAVFLPDHKTLAVATWEAGVF